MTADDVLDILERTYSREPGHMLFLREFPLQAGERKGQGRTPKIDALLIGLTSGYLHHRTAFEVKVDRKDFLRELTTPQKRQPALAISNQYYFAVPEGLISPAEVPSECGLIEVADYGTIVRRSAPSQRPKDLDWPTTIDIARRAFQLGQQDWAKRTPLDGWYEIQRLVEVTSELEIDFDEQLETLRALAQRMRQNGRSSEARFVEKSAKKLRQRAKAFIDGDA